MARDSLWPRLLIITVLWLAATRLLPLYGIYLIPLSLARQMTLQAYLLVMQIATTALGLGLSLALLPKLREGLGLHWPTGYQIMLVAVAAPLLFVVSSYVGIATAFRTLLEELARGGAEVSRQNAGEFGRALKQDPALLTILWGVVAAPIAEELLFRGAFWSLLREWTRPLARKRRSEEDPLAEFLEEGLATRAARGLRDWFATGGLATIVAAALFAWMHADLKGGVGIVRVVSALCLGLACGVVRHHSRTVLAAVLLHFVYNALSVGQTRRWWVLGGFTNYYGVSTLLSLVAGVCAVALLVIVLVRYVGKPNSPASS